MRLMLYFFFSFSLCTSLYSQSTNQNAMALLTFESILKIMKQNYFDQSYHNLPWEELSAQTRKKIANAPNLTEAYDAIQEQLKQLKHSHLVFSPFFRKKQNNLQEFTGGGSIKEIPFQFALYQNSLLVTKVAPPSAAYESGLRAGMLIQKIGVDDVSEIIQAYPVHAQINSILQRYSKDTLTLTCTGTNQQKLEINFPLGAFTGKLVSFGNIQGYPYSVESTTPKEGIGYLAFNIFLFEQAQWAVQTVQEFKEKNYKGLIIDLRNNPGGQGLLACAIAKEFCTESYSLGIQHTTANNGVKELRFPVQKQPRPFTVPIVILINESSASTSEIMAIGMQENKSATIIGTKSAGAALPSFIVQLEDGSFFQYPIADFKTPQGKSLEGIGVIPDIETILNPEDFSKGQDTQLQAAITLITEKISKP